MSCANTIVITGATGGLGRAIVQRMKELDQSFEAILTVRSLGSPKAKDLRAFLGQDSRFRIWQLDLEDLENVRTFSTSLRIYISSGRLKPITAIICNAGFMSRLRPKFTKDGYERAFQINYLGHFLLVNSLVPVLDRSHCRVVFVTSFTHDPTCLRAKLLPLPRKLWMETERMARPPVSRRNSTKAGFARYARSKMCLMMFMHSLQEKLGQSTQFQDIAIVAVDPGFVGATEIMKEQNFICKFAVERVVTFLTPLSERLFSNSLLRSPTRSANDIVSVGLDIEVGRYSRPPKAEVCNGLKLQKSSKESRDKRKQEELWDFSLMLAGLAQDEKTMVNDGTTRVSENTTTDLRPHVVWGYGPQVSMIS